MENLSNGQVSGKVNGVCDGEADLEFLPLVYEIIKSIERDLSHDSTQKTRETQDASLKILELEKKLNQAREQINRLPGIEHSQEEQLKQVDNLRKQLALKRRGAKLFVYTVNKFMSDGQLTKQLESLKSLKLSDVARKLEELQQKKK